MPLSDEDKAEMGTIFKGLLEGDDFKALISKTATDASKAQIGALGLDDKFKLLTDGIEGLKPKDGDPDPKPKDPPGTDPKILAQLDAMKKQLEEQTAATETANSKARNQALMTAVSEALGKAGVPDTHKSAALATLEKTGVLGFGEDEAPAWKAIRYEQETTIPIEEGLGEWLKTSEGKIFNPPVPGTGSGGRGGRPAGGGGGGRITEGDELAKALGMG